MDPNFYFVCCTVSTPLICWLGIVPSIMFSSSPSGVKQKGPEIKRPVFSSNMSKDLYVATDSAVQMNSSSFTVGVVSLTHKSYT